MSCNGARPPVQIGAQDRKRRNRRKAQACSDKEGTDRTKRRKRADSSAQIDIVERPLRDQAHAKSAPEEAAFFCEPISFFSRCRWGSKSA
jgi:hypothetical protein